MTKSKVHAILGDLHTLLATYGSADFMEASSYQGLSPAMNEALRSLAQEAEPSKTELLRKAFPKARNGKRAATGAPGERVQILNLIRRSTIFESTRSILAYANKTGLKLASDPKEGKQRLASKLTSVILKLPNQKKNEIISSLLAGKNNQTQGWIDVIKSGKQ